MQNNSVTPATVEPSAERRFAGARGSAQHQICKDCIHRWPQDGAPPYHPDSWCYMFRTGEHVNAQGYCGQFRISPDVPNADLSGGKD